MGRPKVARCVGFAAERAKTNFLQVAKLPGASGIRIESLSATMREDLMELDDLTFLEHVREARGTVLVAFGLPALRSSRELMASLARVASAFHERARVHHVEVTAHPSLARHCRIETVPTVLVFRDGCELGRLEGARPDHHYHLAIASALDAPAGAELCGQT